MWAGAAVEASGGAAGPAEEHYWLRGEGLKSRQWGGVPPLLKIPGQKDV